MIDENLMVGIDLCEKIRTRTLAKWKKKTQNRGSFNAYLNQEKECCMKLRGACSFSTKWSRLRAFILYSSRSWLCGSKQPVKLIGSFCLAIYIHALAKRIPWLFKLIVGPFFSIKPLIFLDVPTNLHKLIKKIQKYSRKIEEIFPNVYSRVK